MGNTNVGTISLSVEENVGYGIKSQNSKISWDGRLYVLENLIGITCDTSILEIDKILVGLNQLKGIELINSIFKYNKNKLLPYSSEDTLLPQFTFSGNGQHLDLQNSKMLPYQVSDMPSVYGRMFFRYPIGTYQELQSGNTGLLPQLNLRNNSEAILVHPDFERTVNECLTDQSCRGSEISVTHGSIVVLKGSKNYCTKIFGPATRSYQSRMAGLYAGSNGIIEINGPTVIGQYGVDILAENGSIINIGPHRDRANGSIDVSSFNLSSNLNHTAVELHSTRACIVVDKLSTLNAKDLGSYAKNWGKTTLGASAILSGVDYPINTGAYNFEPFVSAGSLQFYPNPNDSDDYNLGGSIGIQSVTHNATAFTLDSSRGLLYYLTPGVATPNTANLSGTTNGGMCVRALNGSIVNLLNVNFPCGWWNPSAVYYDSSATGADTLCNRLFIWNIADRSQIKASLISVSGLFPADAGYVGPSGLWGSGTGGLSVASGLPMGTPDTSSLSILDYFGKGTINPYGQSSARNFGPFRLYFSVNPAVNVLNDLNSNTYGAISQIYSQGYQPSSNLIASGSVSSLYTMLLQRNSAGTIVPSGYYYGSGMMESYGFIGAFLDESAAETFANAKHCAVGKSGNARLVSIYFPYTATRIGDSATNSVKSLGKGIKSVNIFDLERND